MAARNYTNLHQQTTLSANINSSVTSITLTSNSGLPVSYPYSLAIEYGTSNVEIVSVTGTAGANLTVIRGEDGTSAQAHNAGAVVVHAVTARDLSEPQVHIAAAGNIHGIGAPSSVVGTQTTQTLTNKTIDGGSNTLSNVPDSALVAIAASKITQPFASLSTGSLAATGNATVGGTLGITGATTAAAITSSGTVQGATVTATGAVNGATAAITGNATVGGTLGVTGATTLTGGVSGTVTATGAVTGTTLNGTTDVQRNGVSLPRGYVGSATINADVSASTTEVAALSVTFTAVAGRRYKVIFTGPYSADTATDLVGIRFRYKAGATVDASGTLIRSTYYATPQANSIYSASVISTVTGIAAGQTTIGVMILLVGGLNLVHIPAASGLVAELIIEDCGT